MKVPAYAVFVEPREIDRDRYSTGLIVARNAIIPRRWGWLTAVDTGRILLSKGEKIVSRLTRRRIYVPTANGFFRFWNRFWIVFGALVHHGPDGIRVTDNNTRDDPRRLLFATADVPNDLPKRISNDRKRF